MVRRLKLAVAGLALAIGLIFVVQNTELVAVRFLMWDLSMSRALMFILVFGLGFLAGWLSRFRQHP